MYWPYFDCHDLAGYGKMPGYEHIFTDFLLGLVQSKHKKRAAKPVEEPV